MTETKNEQQERENPLERIILSNKRERANVFYYNPITNELQYPKTSTDLNKDYQSGASIHYVPSSQLPHGALGFYHPASHSITLSSNLSSHVEIFVKAHESAHAQGYKDESATDCCASSQTGYAHPRFFGNNFFVSDFKAPLS